MTLQILDGAGSTKHVGLSGDGTPTRPFQSGPGELTEGNPGLYRFLDLVGDGSGAVSMNVNGATTPVSFLLVPPAGQVYRVARMIWSLRDTGTFDSGGWGNNGGTALPNGFLSRTWFGGTPVILSNFSITSHFDLAGITHDMNHHSWGAGDEFITARLTLTKAGRYIVLDGDNSDYMEVQVRDDLTYLVDQKVSVQGHIIIK